VGGRRASMQEGEELAREEGTVCGKRSAKKASEGDTMASEKVNRGR